jgi:uncharacterized protein
MQPLFIPIGGEQRPARFAVLHEPPPGALRGHVVFAHAFAEEMNKSRRMVAMQARTLATLGFAVLLIDLDGCGDSEGDFGIATWDRWIADVAQGCGWLRSRHHGKTLPMTVWGMRSGALLAAAAARRLGDVQHLLLWQPALQGRSVLQQFLRLRVAGELTSGNAKVSTDQLRSELAAGRSVHIAGYEVSPGLAHGLDAARLDGESPAPQVTWFEVSSAELPKLSAAAAEVVGKWRAQGCSAIASTVRGPAFWQTTEIESCPELIEATSAGLMGGLAKQESALH